MPEEYMICPHCRDFYWNCSDKQIMRAVDKIEWLVRALDQHHSDSLHGPPIVGDTQAYYARQDAYSAGGLEGLAAYLRGLEEMNTR